MSSTVRRRELVSLSLYLVLILAKIALARFAALGDAKLLHAIVLEGPLLLSGLMVLDLAPARFRQWSYLVFNLIISLVLLAITLFASYFDQLPSVGMALVLNQSAAVKGSIVSLFMPFHGLLFIDLPLLAILTARGSVGEASAVSTSMRSYPGWAYALIIPGVIVSVLNFRTIRHLPLPLDSQLAARDQGLLIYEMSTMMEPPQGKGPNLSCLQYQTRIQELENMKAGDRVADFPIGVAKGRNLIVIQVEALQTAVIDARVGGREVTPSLNRLKKECWFFPNTATSAGLGSTSDAEFVVNTSLFPPPRAAASVKYANRVLPSLPRVLGQQGYQTLTYHTNWSGFWRRSDLYPALGFSRFFDQAFFGQEDRIAFGASDEVLFRRTLEDLLPRFQQGKAFYAFIITMSSHHPFDQIPSDRLHLSLPSPFAGTYTGRYLAAVEFADRALGKFIEDLRKTGLLDASILVIYGDHGALLDRNQPKSELAAQRILMGHDLSPLDRLRIPLFIRMPRQSRGHIRPNPAGQIDIFPTLADALSLDLSKTIHFGRNLFDGSTSMIACNGFLPPGSYLEDDLLYVSGEPFEQGTTYQLSTGMKGPMSMANPARRDASRELLRLSESLVQHLPLRRQGH